MLLVGPFGRQGHIAGTAVMGLRTVTGENGFLRSKSFKTKETLFLRNIQVIPAWDACSVQ